MRVFGVFPLLFLIVNLHAQQRPDAQPSKAASPPATLAVPYSPGLDTSSIDKSVDPCVDFYAYACSGWQNKNPIPADQSSWSVTSKLQEGNRELLRGILQNAAVPDPHRGPI